MCDCGYFYTCPAHKYPYTSLGCRKQPRKPSRKEVLNSHASYEIARFTSGQIDSEQLAEALKRNAELYDHKGA